MIKRISLALFTIGYVSVSLVIFGIKVNHHIVESHDNEQKTHTLGTINGCSTDSNSCISCDEGWGEECCNDEATCLARCSKGAGLYIWTNPKSNEDQVIDQIDITPFSNFTPSGDTYTYKIIGFKNKQPIYQTSQTPHYRVGIIELLV